MSAHGGIIRAWQRRRGAGYSAVMDVIECIECFSPMAWREGMWQCDNCFSAYSGAPMNVDDVEIEEGLTMADVMRQYEERGSRE